MPTPWLKKMRKAGQLSVHNKAKSWSVAVDDGIKSFNALNLGLKLVVEKEEKKADIVMVLAGKSSTYTHRGNTVSTPAGFKPEGFHGQTSTLMYVDPKEIFFACIFLPGKIKKATNGIKQVVVVHEFLHAAGLNENKDHDSSGVMFSPMKVVKGGLLEYLADQGAKPMPPIRVGSRTKCRMKMLWDGGANCK